MIRKARKLYAVAVQASTNYSIPLTTTTPSTAQSNVSFLHTSSATPLICYAALVVQVQASERLPKTMPCRNYHVDGCADFCTLVVYPKRYKEATETLIEKTYRGIKTHFAQPKELDKECICMPAYDAEPSKALVPPLVDD